MASLGHDELSQNTKRFINENASEHIRNIAAILTIRTTSCNIHKINHESQFYCISLHRWKKISDHMGSYHRDKLMWFSCHLVQMKGKDGMRMSLARNPYVLVKEVGVGDQLIGQVRWEQARSSCLVVRSSASYWSHSVNKWPCGRR